MKKLLWLMFIIRLAAGAEPNRVTRLNSIAERISGIMAIPSRAEAPVLPGGISLLAPEGQAFVGRQLDQFDRSEPGVLRATKPAWINLYYTESRDFVLSGEVNLGGEFGQMLFSGDLPDGFALFVREWDGVQRYQLDSRRATVKRRLHQGRHSEGIEGVGELAPAALGEWTSFKVAVAQSGIQFEFGGGSVTIGGPLDVDGANKVAIVPGTKVRNLRLSFETQPARAKQVVARGSIEVPPRESEAARVLVNGGFEERATTNEQGQFGEPMFAPGSKGLVGWSVADGLVGVRQNPASPSGGFVLELGPRDTPGSVSQTIETEPGKAYELSFFASSGRNGGNSQILVHVDDNDETIECNESYKRIAISFKAQGARTTIRFSGVGHAGFGPLIDDVRIK